MGLTTGAPEFEAWLAGHVSPKAYYYRLPDNFSGEAVICDLSAVTVAGFMSKSSITADDMTQSALRVARSFATAETASRIYGPVEDRMDYDGCIAHERESNPEFFPEMKELRKALTDNDTPRMTDTAKIIYSLDDGRYLPLIRSMVHEDRSYDKKAVTDSELLDQYQWHVFGTRNLPGNYPTSGEPLPEQKKERSDACSTPCVRSALRTYLPWSMMQHLVSQCICQKCYGSTSPHEKYDSDRFESIRSAHGFLEMARSSSGRGETQRADKHMESARVAYMTDKENDGAECICHMTKYSTGRSVIIDAVPRRFDADTYVSQPLHRVPGDFYKRTKRNTRLAEIQIGSNEVKWKTPPAIGESDLKLVHYILAYTQPGDDVLVRNIDSDVFYILLLNAHRFADPDSGKMNRRIFLDQGHSRLSEKRLLYRYVCINQVYADLDVFARKHWSLSKTDPVPHAFQAAVVFSSVVFMSSSDYTTAFAGASPAKRIAVLQNEVFMQKATTMFGHVGLQRPFDDMPQVVSVSLSLDFRRLITLECAVGAMKMAEKKALKAQGPTRRHDYNAVRSVIGNHSKFQLPSNDEIIGNWSRISWALTYMANAPLNCGVVPSCTALSYRDRPLWGWNMSLKSHTAGSGKNRSILPVQWRSVINIEGKSEEEKDCYVPVSDNCVENPGPLILEQPVIEVKARREAGPDCYHTELVPRWVFDLEK